MKHLKFALGGRVRLVAFAALGLFAFAACAGDSPQNVLDPAGEFARKADSLWDLTFAIAVVVFFVVELALIFTLFRFRQRPGREAAQFHGNTKVEVLLTAIPALILAGIAVPTVRTIFDLSQEPNNAVNIRVIAHQFWWEYQYEDYGIVTANEMHIPAGRPVQVTLDGALTDRVTGDSQVIHSFWVPRLAGTQDIIPGRITTLLLEADRPGVFYGQCKEFCGLGHAEMKVKVFAHSPDDFEAWVAEQKAPEPEPSDGLVAEGQRLFSQGRFREGLNCASCHAVEAAPEGGAAEGPVEVLPNSGPNLANFGNRTTIATVFENNSGNLKAWIENPPEMKAGARMPALGLSAEEIDAVVAYLESLK